MRTDKLKAIHQQQIDYVNDSGISVEVVEIYGQVTLTNEDDSTLIYLEGFEAEVFISEAKYNWTTFEDITMAEAYELQAYKYADIEA